MVRTVRGGSVTATLLQVRGCGRGFSEACSAEVSATRRVAPRSPLGEPIDMGSGRTRYEMVRLFKWPGPRGRCSWGGCEPCYNQSKTPRNFFVQTPCATGWPGVQMSYADHGAGPERDKETGSAAGQQSRSSTGGAIRRSPWTRGGAGRATGFGRRSSPDEMKAGPTHTWSGLRLCPAPVAFAGRQ